MLKIKLLSNESLTKIKSSKSFYLSIIYVFFGLITTESYYRHENLALYLLVIIFLFTLTKLFLSEFYGKRFPIQTDFQWKHILHISLVILIIFFYTLIFYPTKSNQLPISFIDLIYLCVLIPVLEEFYYRYGLFGFKYYILVTKIGLPIFWVIASNSIIFALMHTQGMDAVDSLQKFLQILPLSILLAVIRVKSFFYCVFAHMLFNLLVTIFGI